MLRDLLIELVFEYYTISRLLVIHPPSIFTYGPPTAVGAPAARPSKLTAGMRSSVPRLILSLVWNMMAERFITGLYYDC